MEINFYKTYFEIEKNHWLMKIRRKIIYDVLEKLYPEKRLSSIKLLDYGCGSGFIVGELQKRGGVAHGVDTSIEAIGYGISQGVQNLHTLSGNMDFLSDIYDVILAMDVLEHVDNE